MTWEGIWAPVSIYHVERWGRIGGFSVIMIKLLAR